MKRILCSSAIAVASGLTAAACSSSSTGGFDPRVCALASACLSSSSLGFGGTCQILEVYSRLASQSHGDVSPGEKLVSAQIDCLQAAQDCNAIKACAQATPTEVAACSGAT